MLYDLQYCTVLPHVARWQPYNLHDLQQDRYPGLDLYYTDPAQHVITAG